MVNENSLLPDKKIIDLEEIKTLVGTLFVPSTDGKSTKKFSLDTLIDFVDKKYIVNLGNFDTAKEAEDKAKENVVNNLKNCIFIYTVANLDNGIIINSVIQNSVYQFLIYRGVISKRTITSSGATDFEENSSGGFKQKLSVLGPKIFALTTDSTKDDIKAALTDSISQKIITEKDLDECIKYGKTIKDAITNGTVQIGWSGRGFIFVEVGLQNPTKSPYLSHIVINVDEETDTYEVLKNGESKPIATSDQITSLESKMLQDAPNDENTYGRNKGAWVKIPGKISTSENGGEIFNDYETNIANALHSHVEGSGNIVDTNGSCSHAEGKYNKVYGAISHIEGGAFTNIYLSGEAGSKKYQLSKGFLLTSLPPEELVDYFKQSHIKIINYSVEGNPEFDANIVDVTVEDEKLYLTFDKTLSDSETFTDKKLGINRNVINSYLCHTEGFANYSKDELCHIEGNDNTSLTPSAHIEGVLNFAKVEYSGNISGRQLDKACVHIEGFANIALNPCEHIQGCYNVSHTGDTDDKRTLHSIGWGTKGNRKNLQEVMWDGSHYIIGIGDYNGVDIETAKSVQEVITSLTEKIKELESTSNIPEAPKDGKTYGRKDGTWVEIKNGLEVQNIEGATPTQELKPNVFYIFGEVTSLTLTLGAEISGIYNEYIFQFVSGSTPTNLSLPDSVKWIGDKSIEANKTYQVSIVNNIAVLGGVDNG